MYLLTKVVMHTVLLFTRIICFNIVFVFFIVFLKIIVGYVNLFFFCLLVVLKFFNLGLII